MPEWEWLAQQIEGQFLKRKSCSERRPSALQLRSIQDAVWDVNLSTALAVLSIRLSKFASIRERLILSKEDRHVQVLPD